jgi:hypothetical protein
MKIKSLPKSSFFSSSTLAIVVASLSMPALSWSQTRGDRNGPQNNLDAQIERVTDRLAGSILDARQHVYLRDSSKRELLDLLNGANRILRAGQTNPDYPPYPGYGPRMDVRAFSDDNCSRPITPVIASDSCGALSGVFGNAQVWSVSIDGRCINTPDRSFTNVCPSLVAAAAQPRIEAQAILYADDNCSNQVIGIDPNVDYRTLDTVLRGMPIWSIRLDNRCINIPDVNFTGDYGAGLAESLRGMRAFGNAGEAIEFFSDDSCSRPLTYVRQGDRCELLSRFFTNMQVWSVKFRGSCVNISDTTFGNACATYTR